MHVTWKQIFGISPTRAATGIIVTNIPGEAGLGPSNATVFVTATYPMGEVAQVTLFPGGRIATDDLGVGEVGVTTFYLNDGDDKIYHMSWDGDTDRGERGFWNGDIRVVFAGPPEALIDITIQSASFEVDDVDDFEGDLNSPPENVEIISSEFDPDTNEGEVNLQFTYDNPTNEDPVGFAIQRVHVSGPDGSGAGDGVSEGDPPQTITVGSIPWTDGVTTYNFTDYVFDLGEYYYLIYAYKYGTPNSISLPTSPVTIIFGGEETANLTIIGSGGMDLGGAADLVFISNASGIYTLVPNKREDTLYDRVLDTTIDVKIPDPFIKTGYIGG